MKDCNLLNEKKRLINRSATLLCEQITELFNDGYEQGYKDGKADRPCIDTEEAEKKAYNRGLDEAWKAARKIIRMQFEEQNKVFGLSGYDNVLGTYTASEVIAKIKAYEDKKKQDAEIKVGDEIIIHNKADEEIYKAAVIDIDTNEGLWAFDENGCIIVIEPDRYLGEEANTEVKKTNRTFPQIAEVLAELKGVRYDEKNYKKF